MSGLTTLLSTEGIFLFMILKAVTENCDSALLKVKAKAMPAALRLTEEQRATIRANKEAAENRKAALKKKE